MNLNLISNYFVEYLLTVHLRNSKDKEEDLRNFREHILLI